MENWKSIVRNVAPTIGAALAGPMAGTAIKFIADKLLGDAKATDLQIEEALLTASPDLLAELKEIDVQFKLEMKRIDIDVYELEYKDRDSARKLFEVNIWPQIVLSALFVVTYLIVLILLITNSQALATKDQAVLGVVSTVIGVLTAAIPQILSFWFGSSLGSKEKTRGLNLAVGKSSSKYVS